MKSSLCYQIVSALYFIPLHPTASLSFTTHAHHRNLNEQAGWCGAVYVFHFLSMVFASAFRYKLQFRSFTPFCSLSPPFGGLKQTLPSGASFPMISPAGKHTSSACRMDRFFSSLLIMRKSRITGVLAVRSSVLETRKIKVPLLCPLSLQ